MPRAPVWALALHAAVILDSSSSRPPFGTPPGWSKVWNGVKWLFSRDGDGVTLHNNSFVVGQWVSRRSALQTGEQAIDHRWPTGDSLRNADDGLTDHADDLLWATAAADLTYDNDIAIRPDIPVWLRPNPQPTDSIRAAYSPHCRYRQPRRQ